MKNIGSNVLQRKFQCGYNDKLTKLSAITYNGCSQQSLLNYRTVVLTHNNDSNIDTHHIQTAETHSDQEQVEELIVPLSNTIPYLCHR